ncbi:MAG TPA: HAMP domain-containing sensor histidine kinase [Ornithinicoccus sp.]|nr:HAMP domain-containing sensor histidine kinase [Ornithinicoccus sp.]
MILQAVGLSLLAALLLGAVGLVVLTVLARRSLPGAVLVAPLFVILAVAASVLVTANAMFINEQDRQVVLAVLATVTPVGLVLGGVLATRVRRQEAHEALQRSQREMERERETSRRELVAWLSHDLRTPLAGIHAMAEAIGDGHAPDDVSYAERIVHESDRLAQMLSDLLALSRLSSASVPLEKRPTDLGDLASDAVASLVAVADQRGIAILPESEGVDRVVTMMDVRDVSRALRNLLDNAISHTPAGGRVVVGVGAGSGLAHVTVRDGCGGIPTADLERVFDPGWRGTAARSPVTGEGAGLGLPIARGIARAHGGEVSVRNVPGGCEFLVTLPSDIQEVG